MAKRNKKKAVAKPAKKAIDTCVHCKEETEEEQFCFGCKSYVCAKCDKTFCIGKHVPGDHLRVTYGEYHGE